MDQYKPEWVPKDGGNKFTTTVHKGENIKNYKKAPIKKRKKLTIENYLNGILKGDISMVARAITLVESNNIKDIELAQELLQRLPKNKNSIRVGITGVPGAGKSTFIETLGTYLIDQGKKIAVLAIDPSSSLTKGSVLGDKTRMENLSRNSNCFIRPTPSAGALGGVARKTRETIQICEASGFNIILIETVGVGQSEITVRSMVDFFLLLKIAGAGDQLQGIKRGIIELVDLIAINKADGDNIKNANRAKGEFKQALHYLTPVTKGWNPPVLTCSSITGDGIENIWNTIKNFKLKTKKSGIFDKRREEQNVEWLKNGIEELILKLFYQNEKIKNLFPEIEELVKLNKIPVFKGVKKLLENFNNNFYL